MSGKTSDDPLLELALPARSSSTEFTAKTRWYSRLKQEQIWRNILIFLVAINVANRVYSWPGYYKFTPVDVPTYLVENSNSSHAINGLMQTIYLRNEQYYLKEESMTLVVTPSIQWKHNLLSLNLEESFYDLATKKFVSTGQVSTSTLSKKISSKPFNLNHYQSSDGDTNRFLNDTLLQLYSAREREKVQDSLSILFRLRYCNSISMLGTAVTSSLAVACILVVVFTKKTWKYSFGVLAFCMLALVSQIIFLFIQFTSLAIASSELSTSGLFTLFILNVAEILGSVWAFYCIFSKCIVLAKSKETGTRPREFSKASSIYSEDVRLETTLSVPLFASSANPRSCRIIKPQPSPISSSGTVKIDKTLESLDPYTAEPLQKAPFPLQKTPYPKASGSHRSFTAPVTLSTGPTQNSGSSERSRVLADLAAIEAAAAEEARDLSMVETAEESTDQFCSQAKREAEPSVPDSVRAHTHNGQLEHGARGHTPFDEVSIDLTD